MKVKPGDEAPLFTLPDQHGAPWSLQDRRGKPVVLYFYPRDNTSGCTNQASSVRDSWAEFTDRGVAVAGISPDGVDSHAKFARKFDLPHTLLADTEHSVIEAYGAWGEKSRNGKTSMGVIRSSVVIDADGKVAAVFDAIKPDEQAKRTLAALDEL